MEQRQPAPPHRLVLMKTTYVNATIAALSIIAAAAVGLLAPVTTPSGWFILAAAATAPPLVFMHYLKQPAQTTSQSIQEAIR
jgi:ABC-type transport system involved in cytochrome bd biosynthesis fused ATPase/permease subunit